MNQIKAVALTQLGIRFLYAGFMFAVAGDVQSEILSLTALAIMSIIITQGVYRTIHLFRVAKKLEFLQNPE